MKIYLIRHGQRSKHPLGRDMDEPLTEPGRAQVKALATKVQRAGVPTLFLHSTYKHALQTAEILRAAINPTAPLLSLNALTPVPITFGVAEIRREMRSAGHDLGLHDIVAMAMHHPRQTQLAMMMRGLDPTKWQSEPKPREAEAICLVAETLEAFARGEGIEDSRIYPDL